MRTLFEVSSTVRPARGPVKIQRNVVRCGKGGVEGERALKEFGQILVKIFAGDFVGTAPSGPGRAVGDEVEGVGNGRRDGRRRWERNRLLRGSACGNSQRREEHNPSHGLDYPRQQAWGVKQGGKSAGWRVSKSAPVTP